VVGYYTVRICVSSRSIGVIVLSKCKTIYSLRGTARENKRTSKHWKNWRGCLLVVRLNQPFSLLRNITQTLPLTLIAQSLINYCYHVYHYEFTIVHSSIEALLSLLFDPRNHQSTITFEDQVSTHSLGNICCYPMIPMINPCHSFISIK
jgi:hypothetical protein